MTKTDWSDEIKYCAAMVATKGDRNVPKFTVRSYLEMQANSASRENRHEVAAALLEAARLVGAKEWGAAFHGLRIFYLTIDG